MNFFYFLLGLAAISAVETILTAGKPRKLSLKDLNEFLANNPAAVELLHEKLSQFDRSQEEHEKLLIEAAEKLMSDPDFAAKAFDRAIERNQ